MPIIIFILVTVLTPTFSFAATSTPPYTICPPVDFSNNFGFKSEDSSSGGEVSSLQAFLGLRQTGGFGVITAYNLYLFQKSNKIISSSTAFSAKNTFFGPRTRTKLNSYCQSARLAPSQASTSSKTNIAAPSASLNYISTSNIQQLQILPASIPLPTSPVLTPSGENGITVDVGTEVAITSLNSTSIRYTVDNTAPTCTSGQLYSVTNKPKIKTTNTTVKAIGCNNTGSSTVLAYWYFTTQPISSLFDYVSVRTTLGREAPNFDLNKYTVQTPSDSTFVSNTDEFLKAIQGAHDGSVIVLKKGEYDLGLVNIYRSDSLYPAYIRAETPGCYDGTSGVTLTGKTRLRILSDNWRIEGLCFSDIANNVNDEGYSNALKINGSKVTLINNTFRNLGDGSHIFVALQIGGGSNAKGERKLLDKITITRNMYSNIKGIGIDIAQPPSNYKGPYTWAVNTDISYNTFQNSPHVLENGGEAIQLGTAYDRTDAFDDNQSIRVIKNFFNNWNGDSEVISIKSTGNTVEGNLFYNSYGGISVRAGDHNTIERNYMINNKLNCYGIRVSGLGNVFQYNVLDLPPTCVAIDWTVKQLDTDKSLSGLTINTYPSKQNYYRWNKIKNVERVVRLLTTLSNQVWENNPPKDDDLPTSNQIRLNEFINMSSTTLVTSEIGLVSADLLRSKNVIGTDNSYVAQ